MIPRNSIQLLNINTTTFQVEREPVYIFRSKTSIHLYSMCSLAVSTLDSPAVDPRPNPGLGKILMSENLRLYTTSPVNNNNNIYLKS